MKDQISPLIRLLRNPQEAREFAEADWNRCLPQARQANLLARLYAILENGDLTGFLPRTMLDHMHAARAVAEEHERVVRWDVFRLERALCELHRPAILLKGAAYLMAGLPPARGRLVSDVDLLVAKEDLRSVEAALGRNGWEAMKLDKYDQRYYRKWMHELPPLRHRTRKTVADVHHNILPETGRLHADASLLFADACRLESCSFGVLAPADMVLHSAAHMFQDGQIAGSLRDLKDQDDLLRHFGARAGFWQALVPRARLLGLGRPLFYALRYSEKLLGTPIPDNVRSDIARCAPSKPVLRVMDLLVNRALVPPAWDAPSASSAAATWMLYVRSHWLRMPPLLLALHLFRKALRRWTTE